MGEGQSIQVVAGEILMIPQVLVYAPSDPVPLHVEWDTNSKWVFIL